MQSQIMKELYRDHQNKQALVYTLALLSVNHASQLACALSRRIHIYRPYGILYQVFTLLL